MVTFTIKGFSLNRDYKFIYFSEIKDVKYFLCF